MTLQDIEIEKITFTFRGTVFDKIVLLGYAERFALKLGHNPANIANEMTSGSDDHFFKTFERYFGDYFAVSYIPITK
jgi:hypothetical protein